MSSGAIAGKMLVNFCTFNIASRLTLNNNMDF